MLLLTENATSAIRDLVDSPQLPETGGLRIATADEDPQKLTVSAAKSPQAGDQVVENKGARVFLESGAAATLEDKVLDAQVDPGGNVKFQLAQQ